MIITDLKSFLASYMDRTSVNDLTPSNLSPAGINIDLGLIAINAASMWMQKQHDFKACEGNGFISIPSTGGSPTAPGGTGMDRRRSSTVRS